MSHFQAVKDAKAGDYVAIATAISFFQGEAADGQRDLVPLGRLWDTSKRIPGLMAFRWNQLQEVEAILRHVEMLADRKTVEIKQHWMLTSQRSYTDRQLNELVLTDDAVFMLRQLQNEVALVRNTYLGLTKGLEYLHFQMGHLVKMREAGIEDALF